MKNPLATLLNRLEKIGNDHEELFDSDVRNNMSDVIVASFIRPVPGYQFPQSFGMDDPAIDLQIHLALADYIAAARAAAKSHNLATFHQRLAAFQDESIQSREGDFFDDFFGWMNPAHFDPAGNPLPQPVR